MTQQNAPSLDEIFGSQSSSAPTTQQKPSLDEIFGSQSSDNQPSDSGLSSMPTQTSKEDINELNAPENQQTTQQPQDPLNLGDHAALSFIDNPQAQQNYLQKKFPYVIPDGKGGFMAGQSPSTLMPVDPKSSGNTFFSWLASQANTIPSMIGMGVGSIGGVPGAAAGAMAGEGISKDIGQALGANESPLKMGVDTAISGAFGAIGQKAAQMFGMVAGKVIAPKLAQAVDNRLTQMIDRGQDPSSFINFVSKAMHFASGANSDDVKTLMQYGVNKSLADSTVNNNKAIINIAQNFIKSIQETKTSLGQAVGASGMKLMNKAGDVNISNSPIFDYVKQEMQSHPGWGTVNGNVITLNKNAANSADSAQFGNLLKSLGSQDIRTSYAAPKSSELLRMAQDQAKNLGYDINNPTHQITIAKTLGKKPEDIASELEKSAVSRQEFAMGGPKAFKIPTNGNLTVKQAIGTQQIFGQLTDKDKSPLSDDMRRVFTNILYRDGNGNDSPLVNQLSQVAQKNGIDEWTASKDAYKNFMQSIEGRNGVSSLGLDVTSPKSIQDFGKTINSKMPVDKSIMENLENQVGKPIFDKVKQWSAIQSISNHEPNFLRLGAITGLLGSALGDGDLQTHVVRGMELGAVGGIASPYLKTLPLKAAEGVGNMAINTMKGLTSNSLKQAGVSIGSQEGAKLLRSLISKK